MYKEVTKEERADFVAGHEMTRYLDNRSRLASIYLADLLDLRIGYAVV